MRLDRRKARLVAERDLRDATGDLRLILAMVGLSLAIPIASGIGLRALALYGGGVNQIVERLSIVGAFFVVFLPSSYSLVLALESFVGERERSTLEVLLSTPLKEAEIYFGKLSAVLAVALALCYGGLLTYCVITFTGLGYFPGAILASLAVSTICQVAAMTAGAVIVSANARTMRAANVMASFIILPMSVVLQVEAALILLNRGELLWAFAAVMAVVALVLLRMGLAGFSREALLAREAGGKSALSRAKGVFRTAWRTAQTGLSLLRARWFPILTALLGFPVGALIGYLVPSALPDKFAQAITLTLQSGSTASNPAVFAIAFFVHDLLVIFLAALFGALSVGLSGYAVTIGSGAVIGYVAAVSSWSHALSGLLPHGLIELPLMAIAAGLVIHVGASVIHMEPDGGWGARVLRAELEIFKAMAWLAPLLAVSAVLQAFVTGR